MRKLWLLFAQTVTVGLALLFVVMTLKPEWLGRGYGNRAAPVVPLQEAAPLTGSVSPGPAAGLSFREAARKALPSVVHIFTRKAVRAQRHPFMNDPLFRHFFGETPEGEGGAQRNLGLGSGVIVSPQGYILTNNHVIEAADEIEVSLNDGRKLKAKLVGADPESDIAVLQVSAEQLPAITFGQMEGVQVGDVVLAIGNPFGVGQTVTMGIVSALGRSHLGINTFENFIQTDAAINPGNSGGALVDAAGNFIGINTAIYSKSGGSLGIGFAIPVSTARNIMEQIIATGTVTRGWVGIESREITREIADVLRLDTQEGALVAGVMPDSPAATGGLQAGDVIQMINGKKVADPQGMLNIIANLKPDDKAVFGLLREGKKTELSVRIGKRPPLRRERE
jgi:Do/DeqQ family serine protease